MSDVNLTQERQDHEERFAWLLTQGRVDLVAHELYKLHDLLNRAVPGCSEGERVFCLLTDLRVGVVEAGAEDPFPYMPLAPCFPDTHAPTWPDPRMTAGMMEAT